MKSHLYFQATAGRIDAEQKTEKLSGDKEYTLSGRRVLLVEDNALNMEIASEILHMNGVQVVSAENGAEAVKIFQESQLFWFDAVLMDMQMPVMDGCEATKHIRALEREDAGRVPIIAVTANTFSEDMDRTFAAGMNGHISKPVDFKALTDLLKTLMEERDNTEKTEQDVK